ncbi:helix-turn-helix domain-containing protein [Longimonas halophila]|uniref:helix-turn-helix domain-containing protein n=1 Tax=Longimonas halophila TaxID=1469170 RepID=UPI0011425EF3|nr:helix-turn-helix domain-containing protein [Longimonas halophila]
MTKGAGRPPKIDEEAEEELKRVLKAPPTEEGYEATRWTTPKLAERLPKVPLVCCMTY